MNKDEFRSIRKTLGLSQAQLALKLNVLRAQVCRIENGRAGITEQKEEAMKDLLRAHRLKNKKTNVYTRPKREKICFAFPWYSYQNSYQRNKKSQDSNRKAESG